MGLRDQPFIQRLLGVNWKTTIMGVGSLITALGVILNSWRTKDVSAIFSQAQTLLPIITLILTGLGFLNAKDNNTTGAGEKAKKPEEQ